MAETAYIVLREATTTVNDDSRIGWREVEGGPWNALTPQAAIKLALTDAHNPSGRFVAVPVRSFKLVIVRSEQTTVLRIENAQPEPT